MSNGYIDNVYPIPEYKKTTKTHKIESGNLSKL